MNHYKGIVSYFGTPFLGFQKTKMGPSIEGELERALETLLRHPVKVQGASRTDRGVHAEGQVIDFFTTHPLDLYRMQRSFNGLLPKEIVVKSLEKVPSDFHPTLNAKRKFYRYQISNGPIQLPFDREIAWHYPQLLDREAMQEALPHLIGKRDFSSFANELSSNPVCTLETITLSDVGSLLQIDLLGDRFLYKMVRNLVGTLVHIGRAKISNTELPLTIKEKDRRRAGMTAPAHGLFLMGVSY